MSEQDREAAYDLAAEMSWGSAAKFLRAELEIDLRQAAFIAERIAKERPGSEIHRSFYNTTFAPFQP